MAEFDDKLHSILSNPEIMQRIMSMASAMGQSSPAPEPPAQRQSQPPASPPQQNPGLPFDPSAMMGMMELLKSTQIGAREQNLIRALHGFVPDDRLIRLEKAMQASRIARYAATAMQNAQGR